jgi:hypothetical protein
MTAIASNTVSKLYYFDKRIKGFYEKQGYNSMPFDGVEVQKMIVDSQKELKELFYKIWGLTMGNHLLDIFYDFKGNIHEFYMHLDTQNQQLFSTINW